jgi:hypothetical protein
MNSLNFNKSLIFYTVVSILISASLQAQDLPANLQAALFKKIFAFDKTLESKQIEVVVLGSGDGIVAAFKEAGISAKAVSGNQLPAGVNVVYVNQGVTATKSQSASKGVLSISGTVSLVENGQVAIGLSVEGGKPKIVVNLPQLKAEGHEIAADLLKIAKIIQ